MEVGNAVDVSGTFKLVKFSYIAYTVNPTQTSLGQKKKKKRFMYPGSPRNGSRSVWYTRIQDTNDLIKIQFSSGPSGMYYSV